MKTKIIKKLKTWLDENDAATKDRAAGAAGVQKAYMLQVATGLRRPKIAIAARLEAGLRKADPATTITRADLVPECKACPFYKACAAGKEKS